MSCLKARAAVEPPGMRDRQPHRRKLERSFQPNYGHELTFTFDISYPSQPQLTNGYRETESTLAAPVAHFGRCRHPFLLSKQKKIGVFFACAFGSYELDRRDATAAYRLGRKPKESMGKKKVSSKAATATCHTRRSRPFLVLPRAIGTGVDVTAASVFARIRA